MSVFFATATSSSFAFPPKMVDTPRKTRVTTSATKETSAAVESARVSTKPLTAFAAAPSGTASATAYSAPVTAAETRAAKPTVSTLRASASSASAASRATSVMKACLGFHWEVSSSLAATSFAATRTLSMTMPLDMVQISSATAPMLPTDVIGVSSR